MKKIIFTIINDLSYDRRMERICNSLAENGFEVLLMGRELKSSIPLYEKKYNQKRLKCFFNKGKLFYVEYNIRIFIFLLFHKVDIIGSVDTDTLLAGFIVSKIRNKKFVFDAHEYFTEVPELTNRPFVKNTWKFLEKLIIPKIKNGYTVSEGLSNLFKKNYGVDFKVIKNVPLLCEYYEPEKKEKYILYQGAVNVGRGLEEMITAMQYVDCNLYIFGNGDIFEELKKLVKKEGIEEKVRFFGNVNEHELMKVLKGATIGINLLKENGFSYYYSLANKFFDYIHAGLPQITMNFPEYKKINDEFEVALLIDKITGSSDADNDLVISINKLLNNNDVYQTLKNNCLKAMLKYNWQNEEKKLMKIYTNLKQKFTRRSEKQ